MAIWFARSTSCADWSASRELVRLAGRFDPAAAQRALEALDNVEVLGASPEALTIATRGASRTLPALFGALAGTGAEIQETTLKMPSLESLFITLTGRELRE